MEENEEQFLLLDISELPRVDEPKKKVKPRVNCLQEMLIELMNERGLKDVDVVKATGIPWPTWSNWIHGQSATQQADRNLLNVAKFFNVSLFYLLYGIGNDDPFFADEEKEEDKDGL